MIAIDTNILVYAHRKDSPWHVKAREAVRKVAEGPSSWAVAWPSIHEFLAVVTHPKIYRPASTITEALDQVAAWTDSPFLESLSESGAYLKRLSELLEVSQVVGPRVHDARIAALCLHHGVRILWSHDRDFSRFPQLIVHDPMVD